jgi:predicted ATPase
MRPATTGPYLLDLVLDHSRVPSFKKFPFNLAAVRYLRSLSFHPRVTFLVGENGSGKSTLLEAIAVACDLNPEGGSRNFNFGTRESHSALDRYIRLKKSILLPLDAYFLRAESFYNVATEIERLGPEIAAAYGNKPLHEQSHGESFFALFEYRFHGAGLYLLDEPEAALSPTRQMSFLALLHRFCAGGAQFVIATHSPIIMAYPDAWIYVLGDTGPVRVPYEETEHYKVSRTFLANPKKMLDLLLDDEANEGSGSE